MVFSVNGTGVVFAQDATSGRVISGTVSIINASYNAYSVTISYASCQGQYAILNGAQLTGLGTLDNTVAPERGVVGVSGTAGATKVAIVETLNRT